MDALIKVDGSREPEKLKAIADALCRIMDSAKKNGMEQQTVREAFMALQQAGQMHTNIHGCQLYGDKHVS